MRYRMPLILVIAVNTAMILRTALPPTRQAQAQRPADHRLTANLKPDNTLSGTTQQRPPIEASAPLAHASETASLCETTVPLDSAQLPGSPRADTTVPATDSATNAAITADVARDDAVGRQAKQATINLWSESAEQPRDSQPLAADHIAADHTASAAFRLSNIPMKAWRRDARQLMQRWQHAAQSMLSTYRSYQHQQQAIAADNASDAQDGDRSAEASHAALAFATNAKAATSVTSSQQIDPASQPIGLTLRNATENAETIRFLVDHRRHELLAGEAHLFPPADAWHIQYHPGGEFKNVERIMTPGSYHFIATDHGWDIVPDEHGTQPR